MCWLNRARAAITSTAPEMPRTGAGELHLRPKMKQSGASQSASEIISRRMAELGDWRGKRTLIKGCGPGR